MIDCKQKENGGGDLKGKLSEAEWKFSPMPKGSNRKLARRNIVSFVCAQAQWDLRDVVMYVSRRLRLTP